jgi:hypothetical protein
MPRLIVHYPDGAAGLALLLMRLSLALAACPSVASLWRAPTPWWLTTFSTAAFALALVLGFGTRLAALLLAAGLTANALTATGDLRLLLMGSAGSAAALLLMGPGAYSVDARRFGRRVIRLEPRSPDRGGTG